MCDTVDEGLRKDNANQRRLVELGCGDGSIPRALASLGFDVHGIDIVPTAGAFPGNIRPEPGVAGVSEKETSWITKSRTLDRDCSWMTS
ncbi:MAG: hypothetical protein AMJ46_13885 [Latescibacteria bacterium DG_63]|nr:MAG: hypothetical protein AMJ46_13885 [Latescibacteria bacterium DG_63]